MRVSLWTRAGGRVAVTFIITLLTWCALYSWLYWAQVCPLCMVCMHPSLIFAKVVLPELHWAGPSRHSHSSPSSIHHWCDIQCYPYDTHESSSFCAPHGFRKCINRRRESPLRGDQSQSCLLGFWVPGRRSGASRRWICVCLLDDLPYKSSEAARAEHGWGCSADYDPGQSAQSWLCILIDTRVLAGHIPGRDSIYCDFRSSNSTSNHRTRNFTRFR